MMEREMMERLAGRHGLAPPTMPPGTPTLLSAHASTQANMLTRGSRGRVGVPLMQARVITRVSGSRKHPG